MTPAGDGGSAVPADRSRFLLEQLTEYAVIFFDCEGTIEAWNPGAEALFGWPAAEAVGRPGDLIFTESDRRDEVPRKEMAIALLKGRAGDDRWHLRRDGSLFRATGTMIRLDGPDGERLGFAKIVRDVTAQYRLEQARASERELLDAVLRSVDNAVVVCDEAGHLVYANRAARELHGDAGAPAAPERWAEAYGLRAADGSRLLRLDEVPLWRALQGESVRHQEMLVAPGGLPARHVIASAHAMHAAGGEKTGAVMVEVDVTARRRLEAELREALRLEAVGKLAGGVAHEVNNAMSGVLGFGDLLLRRLDPADPRREDVEQILRAGRRAAEVTRQLLAYSRRQLLQPRVLDLGLVVERFAPLMRQTLGPDKELVVRTPPAPVLVRADEAQLEQVLLNLALNARDAMHYGGRLTVEVGRTETPDFASLVVADTGVGMDQATRDRAFEPFFTTKPVGQGTGLGLSTVYGIVKQSGGEVELESAPGRGTTFRIRLPTAAPEAPAVPPRRTVLVVDDEPVVRDFLSRLLESGGWSVAVATSGAEGLEQLERLPDVALVVSDAVMPGISGREFGARVRERHPTLPVLYTSGHTDEEAIRRGLLEPGAAFVQKPLDPDRFLAIVERLAAGPR